MEPDGGVSDGGVEKETPQRLPSFNTASPILRVLTFWRGNSEIFGGLCDFCIGLFTFLRRNYLVAWK